MADRWVLLTEEDAGLIADFLRERKRQGGSSGEQPPPLGQPLLSFVGKFQTTPDVDLSEGTLPAPFDKIMVKQGPARGSDASTDVIPNPITCHYLFGEVASGADPWLLVWDWYGKMYVTPLQCFPIP